MTEVTESDGGLRVHGRADDLGSATVDAVWRDIEIAQRLTHPALAPLVDAEIEDVPDTGVDAGADEMVVWADYEAAGTPARPGPWQFWARSGVLLAGALESLHRAGLRHHAITPELLLEDGPRVLILGSGLGSTIDPIRPDAGPDEERISPRRDIRDLAASLRALAVDPPLDLAEVLDLASHPDPDQRPSTALSFANELRATLLELDQPTDVIVITRLDAAPLVLGADDAPSVPVASTTAPVADVLPLPADPPIDPLAGHVDDTIEPVPLDPLAGHTDATPATTVDAVIDGWDAPSDPAAPDPVDPDPVDPDPVEPLEDIDADEDAQDWDEWEEHEADVEPVAAEPPVPEPPAPEPTAPESPSVLPPAAAVAAVALAEGHGSPVNDSPDSDAQTSESPSEGRPSRPRGARLVLLLAVVVLLAAIAAAVAGNLDDDDVASTTTTTTSSSSSSTTSTTTTTAPPPVDATAGLLTIDDLPDEGWTSADAAVGEIDLARGFCNEFLEIRELDEVVTEPYGQSDDGPFLVSATAVFADADAAQRYVDAVTASASCGTWDSDDDEASAVIEDTPTVVGVEQVRGFVQLVRVGDDPIRSDIAYLRTGRVVGLMVATWLSDRQDAPDLTGVIDAVATRVDALGRA